MKRFLQCFLLWLHFEYVINYGEDSEPLECWWDNDLSKNEVCTSTAPEDLNKCDITLLSGTASECLLLSQNQFQLRSNTLLCFIQNISVLLWTQLWKIWSTSFTVTAHKPIRASPVAANQAQHLPVWGEKLSGLTYSSFPKQENRRAICNHWETSRRRIKFSTEHSLSHLPLWPSVKNGNQRR